VCFAEGVEVVDDEEVLWLLFRRVVRSSAVLVVSRVAVMAGWWA
jgi:hypothetical protein